MKYQEFMNEFNKLSSEDKEGLAMEILADASPADILDGLYMQKTAMTPEELQAMADQSRKQVKRDINAYKTGVKKTLKSALEYPAKEVRDGFKLKRMLNAIKKNKKALVAGTAIGIAGGMAMNENKEKKAFASSLIDELYKIATITVPDKTEAKKETKPLQDDIECEVCDFKGPPTHDGLCPKCGALGGKKPADEYAKANSEDLKSWGDPYQGISVEEADYIGRMNEVI